MPPTPRRPAARHPSVGLTPDAQSLHAWQAATYHYDALRQRAPRPPVLPRAGHTTARDSDLARQDAQHRYEQTMRTRQMVAETARQARLWESVRHPAPPQYTMRATPNEDYYQPEAVRQRALAYKLAQQQAQLRADHPLEATVGEGVMIGGTIATSAAVSELMLVRAVSGLRWIGLARAATFTSRLTWAGSEAELVGARAAWQEYRALPLGKAFTKVALPNITGDVIAQGGANYLGSDVEGWGWDRVKDSGAGINLVETGMATYGLRPVGIGLGSALFQYSVKDGFQSPLNGRLSWRAFGAQAAIGTLGGYGGQLAEGMLSRRLLPTYRLYRRSAQYVGHDVAYPLWLGSYSLFRAAAPHSIGITEETLENKAGDKWPVTTTPAALPPLKP